MADIVEETFETEVRRKTVRTSYKIEEVSYRDFSGTQMMTLPVLIYVTAYNM